MSFASPVAVGSTKPSQPISEGAASPVRYLAPDGSGVPVVPRTNIRLLPIPECAKGEYDGSDEYRQFVKDRTLWIDSVVKAGGRISDAWQLLVNAGHLVTLKTLYHKNEKAEKFGIDSIDTTVEDADAPPPPPPTVDLEEVASSGRAHPETLEGIQLVIDAGVDRMRAELIAEIEELKPKAAKWAQLKKLRELLGKGV